MRGKAVLNEKAMQAMEARIPVLAECAVRKAYYQALTTHGKVLEAIDGRLVETSADGGQRVIRCLAAPVAVAPGSKRVLRRK